MLWQENQVRDNIRNDRGQRVFYLAEGDMLTREAEEMLRREGIPVLPPPGASGEKGEHKTHLNAQVLVDKTHPRIRFRGKLDSLEAELILLQLACPEYASRLEDVLGLARHLLRCEVLEEPVSWDRWLGMTEEQLHRASHFPQNYFGQPHFMPQREDGPVMARLNRLRTLARETELAAVKAFLDPTGQARRPDILRAMNRMSSMLYILMIEEKVKRGCPSETENDPVGKNIHLSGREGCAGQGQ